ncbi:hypothetical protein CSC94_02235 [Zhengella mangrovi]|uniref:Permease n=1 Tax=Zhengella mangrovi TaxID=1982044 RepID=A0A2G1QTH9_9HYPH|nr:hypothetical protein [Zhengella mangrovi]PHP68833.1 hypothetical protein CSC94_02235 [Zhengella mangrovi]
MTTTDTTQSDAGPVFSPSAVSNPLANTALATTCVLACLETIHPGSGFGPASALALLLFIVTGHRILRLRERYLAVLATGTALLAITVLPEPGAVLLAAAIRSAYLFAFITLLATLKAGASVSQSVLSVGTWLTLQPPGRRYLAIASGGHMMGVIMNFGALSLLGPLVQRGARAGSKGVDPSIVAIRERRQLSALSRGFSLFILWSPTAISQYVCVSVVPGATSLHLAGWGAALAAVLAAAGWLEDRATGLRARKALALAPAATPVPPLPKADVRRLAGIYVALAVLAGGAAMALHVPVVTAIMITALPATAGWLAMQTASGRGDGRPLSTSLRNLFTQAMPDGSPEAVTLAFAGFVGLVMAHILPTDWLAGTTGLSGLPPIVIQAIVLALVPLASIAALPPMLTVTFLGAFLSKALDGVISPDLLALTLVMGWCLNLTSSPFGATNLILSRITDLPATRLAFTWNGRYGLIAFAVCLCALALLSLR